MLRSPPCPPFAVQVKARLRAAQAVVLQVKSKRTELLNALKTKHRLGLDSTMTRTRLDYD